MPLLTVLSQSVCLVRATPHSGVTHSALDVFDLGQDVQVESVRLSSAAVPSVHEVTEGEDQAQHLHHPLPAPKSLGSKVMSDKPSEKAALTTSLSDHYRPPVIAEGSSNASGPLLRD